MNQIEKMQAGLELLNDIYTECHANPTFKQNLISNPERAIEDFKNISMTIPADKTIHVEDQSDESIVYINIPVKPNLETIELSDEELDSVSGGCDFLCGVAAGIVATGIYEFVVGFVDGASGQT